MNTHQITTSPITTAWTRMAALAACAMLGLLLVGGVGFANMPAVHDAAHDVRHTLSFPCH
jgi:cobalt transporter subunit CbtB